MNTTKFLNALCLVLLVLVALCNGATSQPAAAASEPSGQPILRVETGMHTAIIKRICVDVANRYLVTASEDKTARVWELATGKLVRVLRPPISEGNEGRLFSVAISPDGQLISVGGWTSPDGRDNNIYLFERESGRMVRRLTGLPNVINHLVFSPDGKYLAATLAGENGVRVYETVSWQLAGEDQDYGAYSYGADFDAAGRLVTSCQDGYLRLYARPADGVLRLVAKERTIGGKLPFSVKFAPANGASERIAVGFEDTTQVEVYSGGDLKRLYVADTSGVDNGSMLSVAWSWDGGTLYAGGRYYVSGDCPIRAWSNGGRGSYHDVAAARSTLIDLVGLRGGVAYGAADPAFGVIGADGRRIHFTGSAIADYRSLQAGFLLAEDGAELGFGYEKDGKSPARFKLGERKLEAATGVTAKLRPPLTQARGMTVSDWEENYTPKLNGEPLKLEHYEMSHCFAIAPDSESLLLGTEYWLRLFDRNGAEQWQGVIPGVAWGVNISGNGKLAVAALGDGTIRWYRLSDGKELLAFFPHKDKQRWVLWTPSGYYDASPGAEELIGWHVNNGDDAAADFYPVSRFRATYYRPDVIDLILQTLDEGKAVELANTNANRRREELEIARRLPPVIEVAAPADGSEFSAAETIIRYRTRTPSGEPLTGVRALIDGRPAPDARGVGVRPSNASANTPGGGELRLRLPERDCEVSLLAENRYAVSTPATIRMRWRGRSAPSPVAASGNAGPDLLKPALYIFAVGVSRYADASRNLGYAAKDARDFVAALKLQQGGLYRTVVVKLLIDEQATRDEVVDGLEWILRQTTSRDVAMVFFAGHGINDALNAYYFLPHNGDDNRLMRTGVATTEIKKTVESLAGKTLFFIDTCHSGNALGARGIPLDINGLANELASVESGAIVYTASTGRQLSLEDSRWGNGAFTKALIEGLSGAADLQRNGVITTDTLAAYIAERVKALTEGRQTPTTAKPKTIQDFPIAVKR